MTAHEAARYLIWFSHEVGDPISNLKLQKLLYYTQAWHLALYDRPAFSEPIQAWVHGPAVPSVYREYKQAAWLPIQTEPAPPVLEVSEKAHLDEIMDRYGELTAYQLEKLTHCEAPWRDARPGLADDEPSENEITHDSMRTFYKAQLSGQTTPTG